MGCWMDEEIVRSVIFIVICSSIWFLIQFHKNGVLLMVFIACKSMFCTVFERFLSYFETLLISSSL